MGIFGKRKESQAKQMLEAYLNTCNIQLAMESISTMMAGTVIREELAQLVTNLNRNPNVANALELLKFEPKFINFFLVKGSREEAWEIEALQSGLRSRR